jgi:hypothetical protein
MEGATDKGYRWISNDTSEESRKVPPSEVEKYISAGWRMGMRKLATSEISKH